MPDIRNPPPMAETVAFLRNAKPPGEYSKKMAARKRMVIGSVEWLVAFREGASKRPPVPAAPPRRYTRRDEIGLLPLAEYQGKPCPYCHEPMIIGTRRPPTRDHIRPRSRGGRLNDTNRLIVCSPCNHNKSDMTLQQFAEWLTKRGDPRAGIVWSLLDKFSPR